MNKHYTLTVSFETPFWIGIFEVFCSGKYQICKVTFGSEPNNQEIYELINNSWYDLKFSNPTHQKKVV